MISVCVCLQVSGLSVWIGRQLEPMSGLPPWAVTLLACLLVSAVTEFASNPATLTVFLPILSALVRHAHTHTHLRLAGRHVKNTELKFGIQMLKFLSMFSDLKEELNIVECKEIRPFAES